MVGSIHRLYKSHMASTVVTWQIQDDVTWPQKVKVVNQISLKLNISKTVRDRWLLQIDHIYMYYETYGHVRMMSLVANGDCLRLGDFLGTNSGCKILANEG